MTQEEIDKTFAQIITGAEVEDSAAHRWLTPELEESMRLLKERQARIKAAERPYAIPGLDVAWWKEEPPLKVWVHEDVLCALGPGYIQLNGYVCLPGGHPWWVDDLQEKYDGDWPEVHGGITFGPHVTGWIGFDTGHAGDWWDDEEIAKAAPVVAESRAKMRAIGHGSILLDGYKDGYAWDRHWTLAQLVHETEDLARQVKAQQR